MKHDFFEKPMRTPLVVMERSAMGLHQKHSILANDLVRTLSNLSSTMTNNDHLVVIDDYYYEVDDGMSNKSPVGRIMLSQVDEIVTDVDGQGCLVARDIRERDIVNNSFILKL